MSSPKTNSRPLHVQLWSYNYDPEPTGIGPVSTTLAEGLRDRGHQVEVIAAHPHYPVPKWPRSKLPKREVRNGIPVLRLPLWVGKATTAQRYRQELTFMASQFAALPALGRPDVLVAGSPSFPALLPAIVNARLRRLPWLLWLHDILPDGATVTGLVESGFVLNMARRLERAAYQESDLIVALSRAFTDNLCGKDVPRDKIARIHYPATRTPCSAAPPSSNGKPRILSMGNIGLSQGLAPLVDAFERSPAMRDLDAELVITGNGVTAEDVREKVRSHRVQMLGVVDDQRLEQELGLATIGLVSQHHQGTEFNIPSKLMNFMAYGLPILAVVHPRREVARIVRESGAGWVIDSAQPDALPRKLAELSRNPEEVARCGDAAREYADRHFSQSAFIDRFEEALKETIERAGPAGKQAFHRGTPPVGESGSRDRRPVSGPA